MSVTPQEFKIGMRRLAASVCIITTVEANGARVGLTATAVCSMSAEPPTLICCLNRSSKSFPHIAQAGVFAVNVLASHEHEIAQRFSSGVPGEAKFDLGEWTQGETGAPLLASALTAFDCRLVQVVEVGTHAILVGEIQSITLSDSFGKPLLYAEGSYGAFTVHEALAAAGAI